MTNNPVTLDKEYQTRYGRPVRVHATDIRSSHPVLASYLNDAGEWVVVTRLSDGRFKSGEEHPLDLIEKPKTHRVIFYVNVFKDGDYQVYSSRAFADQYLDAMPDRIACKRIEFEVQEGEFDE